MIGFAVVFGLLAVFIAQVWLNNKANVRAKNRREQDASRRADRRRREATVAFRHRAQCLDASGSAVAV
jgi:hypothetical protein